ncbi:MAG: ester cyclase [bacterium]
MKSIPVLLVVAVLALSACTQADHSTEDMKAQMRKNVDAVWNKGNMDIIDDVYAADYVRHNPASWEPATVEGAAAFKEFLGTIHSIYNNDFHVEIHDIVMEGDMSASRWTVTGTLKENGKEVKLEGLNMIRSQDGKIAEEWISWDTQAYMQLMAPGEEAETTMK